MSARFLLIRTSVAEGRVCSRMYEQDGLGEVRSSSRERVRRRGVSGSGSKAK